MPVNIQLSKISIAYSNQYTRDGFTNCCNSIDWLVDVVGPDGIEPSTSPLSGVRSSHLSYGPRWYNQMIPTLVELVGIEPATS